MAMSRKESQGQTDKDAFRSLREVYKGSLESCLKLSYQVSCSCYAIMHIAYAAVAGDLPPETRLAGIFPCLRVREKCHQRARWLGTAMHVSDDVASHPCGDDEGWLDQWVWILETVTGYYNHAKCYRCWNVCRK